VHTLSFSAVLHQFLRQERAVQERVAAALMLSQEQRFTQYVAMQMILHGWVLVEQGQEEKGIARMNEGLAIWRETHAELFLPYYHTLLAEAYGRVGRQDEGIALLDEALANVHNSEEKWWEAELYRLKGELLLKSGVAREKNPL
jgi:predicted ATPase